MSRKTKAKTVLKRRQRKQELEIHNLRYAMDSDLQQMKARLEVQKEQERLAEFTENAKPGDVFVAEGLYEPSRNKDVVVIGGGNTGSSGVVKQRIGEPPVFHHVYAGSTADGSQ